MSKVNKLDKILKRYDLFAYDVDKEQFPKVCDLLLDVDKLKSQSYDAKLKSQSYDAKLKSQSYDAISLINKLDFNDKEMLMYNGIYCEELIRLELIDTNNRVPSWDGVNFDFGWGYNELYYNKDIDHKAEFEYDNIDKHLHEPLKEYIRMAVKSYNLLIETKNFYGFYALAYLYKYYKETKGIELFEKASKLDDIDVMYNMHKVYFKMNFSSRELKCFNISMNVFLKNKKLSDQYTDFIIEYYENKPMNDKFASFLIDYCMYYVRKQELIEYCENNLHYRPHIIGLADIHYSNKNFTDAARYYALYNKMMPYDIKIEEKLKNMIITHKIMWQPYLNKYIKISDKIFKNKTTFNDIIFTYCMIYRYRKKYLPYHSKYIIKNIFKMSLEKLFKKRKAFANVIKILFI